MTATQKYLFDLQGFLVVKDVLTDQECETAKQKITERMEPLDKTPNGYDANGTWHGAWGLLDAGEPFTSLIDHPRLMEVLTEIIAPKLRMEITYSFVRSKGCPQFEMHGGHRGGRVNFRYHVQGDRVFTGVTVVSFTLQDIAESDGRFACIPGSHKCDFPVPEDHQRLFAVDGRVALGRGAGAAAAAARPGRGGAAGAHTRTRCGQEQGAQQGRPDAHLPAPPRAPDPGHLPPLRRRKRRSCTCRARPSSSTSSTPRRRGPARSWPWPATATLDRATSP